MLCFNLSVLNVQVSLSEVLSIVLKIIVSIFIRLPRGHNKSQYMLQESGCISAFKLQLTKVFIFAISCRNVGKISESNLREQIMDL
jgi:hypothetical protein